VHISERVIMTAKPKLYVGCCLTGASEAFTTSVEDFKDSLRERGYEVFDFVGLVNGTAADVYNWDIGHCVADCDAFIAICDLPSIGLGYELCEALRLKKRILAAAHTDARVTRLVLGAAEVEPGLGFVRYEQLSDLLPLVDELVA
jgi:hypothetical protein